MKTDKPLGVDEKILPVEQDMKSCDLPNNSLSNLLQARENAFWMITTTVLQEINSGGKSPSGYWYPLL